MKTLQKLIGLAYLLISLLFLAILKDGIIILLGIIPSLTLLFSKKVIIDL